MWFELHKHTQFSMFDGFDKIKNIVEYAKQLNMKAIGISDHGNASGIIQLYQECSKQGIKPIMGCEVYFQPTFDASKRRYHLCLFAKDSVGYSNLCQIISDANELNFYRYGHTTFELLEKYHEGLICTSACIAGFVPQAISNKNMDLATKATKKFQSIFGEDFYFEVQPIKIDDKQTQETVNETLMKMGKKYGVKCIMTTDSHFTAKEDFDTYLMMHKLSKIGSEKGEGFTLEHITDTYKERYMHSEDEIVEKFTKMHGFRPDELLHNMDEIYDKVDVKLDFTDAIPTYDGVDDTYAEVKQICVNKLKDTGRYNKKYIERVKHELNVIKKHDLCDYFLIVRDYVMYAKNKGSYVGPGRGSVGGSLVAELLGITQIDAIELGTDFDRFLRIDKKKMPDVDLDFESDFQADVINYIMEKYKGRSSRIVTFGYYRGANLINDLCKVYELPSHEAARVKAILKPKAGNASHIEAEDISYDEIMRDTNVRQIEKDYKGFVKHFCKLCGQTKYYGVHPAGVLVTKDNISKYVPMNRIKGSLICAYDRLDINFMNILKFDVLALRTLDVLHDIEQETEDVFDRTHVSQEDKDAMYDKFSKGETLGIFQLNKQTAMDILSDIGADDIQDVIAAISCNRPGALQMKMHEAYAHNKRELDTSKPWYPFTSDAYGAIIYQEHIMRICNGMAKMNPDDTDKLVKFKFNNEEKEILKVKFVKGVMQNTGMSKVDAGELFETLALYMFNKGHGAGYALISEWQMYHKTKHLIEFWYATIKHEHDELKQMEFMAEASNDGVVFFLPHVNYSFDYAVRTVDGDKVIQMGYNSIKNVGQKAAEQINLEKNANGFFKSYDDFYDRCKSRAVTSRVIDSLLEQGALEFVKKTYVSRVVKFNSTLYMKGLRSKNG